MPAGSVHPPLQRADFHVLAIVDSGPGTVTVDFVPHRLEPGTIVWIRPGRVHRWDDIARVAHYAVSSADSGESSHRHRAGVRGLAGVCG